MQTVLEGLRARFDTARERHAAAQKRFQEAQAELQAATNDFSIWNQAVLLETREEEKRIAASHEKQILLPQVIASAPESTIPEPEAEAAPEDTLNKTELVREIIRKHQAGLTAGDVWKTAKGHIASRAYLYSILKRLRDRDEIMMRRKKYMMKLKPIPMVSTDADGKESLLQ